MSPEDTIADLERQLDVREAEIRDLEKKLDDRMDELQDAEGLLREIKGLVRNV